MEGRGGEVKEGEGREKDGRGGEGKWRGLLISGGRGWEKGRGRVDPPVITVSPPDLGVLELSLQLTNRMLEKKAALTN